MNFLIYFVFAMMASVAGITSLCALVYGDWITSAIALFFCVSGYIVAYQKVMEERKLYDE